MWSQNLIKKDVENALAKVGPRIKRQSLRGGPSQRRHILLSVSLSVCRAVPQHA